MRFAVDDLWIGHRLGPAVLEEVDGELRYVAGDDDSGEDRNSLLQAKLFQGRRYVLRIRLYYAWASGQTAAMYW